jgi:hypothetical protein
MRRARCGVVVLCGGWACPSRERCGHSSPGDARTATCSRSAERFRPAGEAEELLRDATRFPDALEKVHSAGPDIWGRVYHAADKQWP